jgi:hypothetical protein
MVSLAAGREMESLSLPYAAHSFRRSARFEGLIVGSIGSRARSDLADNTVKSEGLRALRQLGSLGV